ncbi:MAG: hypothetical protein AAFY38_13845 [Pseudomonadota bacterium]
MKHALLSLLTGLFLVLAGAAFAGPVEDRIVRQLRNQGFTQIEVSRTWLGRSRILATGPRIEREIVVNPVTGEILRDFWTDAPGGGGGGLLSSGDRDTDDGDGDDGDGDGDDGDGDGDGDD